MIKRTLCLCVLLAGVLSLVMNVQQARGVQTTYFSNGIWNSSGNVGIGTTNPVSGKLEVQAGSGVPAYLQSSADAQLTLKGSDVWAGITFSDSASTDNMWYNGTYGTFSIGGGGSSVSGKKLHVNGGMTVGSGYTAVSPAVNGLSVEGYGYFAGGGTGINIGNDSIYRSGAIYLNWQSHGNGIIVGHSSYGDTPLTVYGAAYVNSAGTNYVTLTNSGASTFSQPVTVGTPTTGVHAATKSYVDSQVAVATSSQWVTTGANLYNANSGNVGVGAASPGAKLQVNGTTRLQSTTEVDGGQTLYLGGEEFVGGGDTGGSDYGYIRWDNDNNTYAYWGDSGENGALIIGSYNDGRSSVSDVTVLTSPAAVVVDAQSYFTGNVGIGQITPGAKLHVTNGDASYALFGPNTSWGGKLYVGAGSNQAVALTAQVISTDGNLHVDPAPSKNIYIGYYQPRDVYINPSGGNVGIGTTSPGQKLSVSGIADMMTNRIINVGTPTATADAATKNYVDSVIAAATSSQWVNSGTNLYNANSGNVGVGATSPASKLFVGAGSVAGGALSGLNVALGGSSYIVASDNSQTVFMGEDGSGYGIVGTLTAQDLGFRTGNGEKMRITTAGNVGIGTTSPGYKLDVNGDIRNSGAFLSNVSGGQHITRLPWYNVGSYSGTQGYVKLITPIVDNESNMFQIHITGYRYGYGGNPMQVWCGGYAYSASTLIATDCHTEGGDLPVEIGVENRSGSNRVVVRLGTPTTPAGNWYYNHFTAEYVGWNPKNPSDFAWVQGETTPAQSGNTNNVVADDSAGTQTMSGALTVNGSGSSFSQPVTVGTPTAVGHATTKNYVDSVVASATSSQWVNSGTNLYNANSGNVGIGTASPGYKLDLAGKQRIQSTDWYGLTFDTGTADYLIGRGVASTLTFHVPTGAKFGFYSSGADLLHSIDAGTGLAYFKGNVGIGVTAGTSLTIAQEATYTMPNPGTGAKGAINIRATTSNRETGVTFSSAGSDNAQAGLYVHQDNSAGTHMYLATTDSYATGPQARLTILNNGNIGIGTTSPGQKLAVNGITDHMNYRIINVATPTTGTDAATKSYVDSTVNTGVSGTAGYISKFTAANSIGNTATPIYESGSSVGIGTTSPGARLDVQGGNMRTSNNIQTGNTSNNSGYFNMPDTNAYAIDWASGNWGIYWNTAGGAYCNASGDTNRIAFVGGNACKGYVNLNNAQFAGSSFLDLDNESYYLDPNNTGNSLLVAGNVGIGTTSPGAKLEIAGSVNALRTNYFDIHGDNGSTSDRPYIRGMSDHFVLAPRSGAGLGNTMYLSYPGDLGAGSTVSTRIQETLFISGTGSGGGGNVGIGTASPGQKLSVSGIADMMTNRIINVGTPTTGTDAATKSYVDTSISNTNNASPIYWTDVYGANGDIPWRTAITSPQTMRYVYGPFAYAMPGCAAGTRQFKLYSEFVDNITSGGQAAMVRIALDGGQNIDFNMGSTWGGSNSYRTYLSGFFTVSNTNHASIQSWISGTAGPYVEIRKLQIREYCTT